MDRLQRVLPFDNLVWSLSQIDPWRIKTMRTDPACRVFPLSAALSDFIFDTANQKPM